MPCSRSDAMAAGMAPASMTGTRTAAPMEARRVLGAKGEAHPSLRITASKPKAAAERSRVPTLPGSCTRSSARYRPPVCTSSKVCTGVRKTPNTP